MFGVLNHQAGLKGVQGDPLLGCKITRRGSRVTKGTRDWGAESSGGAHGVQSGPAFGVQNHQAGLTECKGGPAFGVHEFSFSQ